MYQRSDFVFFYSSSVNESKMLSNFYEASFTDPETGITFFSNEQWMMYNKAKFFGDKIRMNHILDLKSSSYHAKQLGRQVFPFDPDQWSKVAEDIVYQGAYLKFSQNEDCKRYLLSTNGKRLVEASRNDSFWGVGFDENDDRICNPANWPKNGNRLGMILERVRAALNNK